MVTGNPGTELLRCLEAEIIAARSLDEAQAAVGGYAGELRLLETAGLGSVQRGVLSPEPAHSF